MKSWGIKKKLRGIQYLMSMLEPEWIVDMKYTNANRREQYMETEWIFPKQIYRRILNASLRSSRIISKKL